MSAVSATWSSAPTASCISPCTRPIGSRGSCPPKAARRERRGSGDAGRGLSAGDARRRGGAGSQTRRWRLDRRQERQGAGGAHLPLVDLVLAGGIELIE